jgi:spore germination protein (amino acid permease)
MEKKSYISSGQIVLLLFVTRLLFSTTYQSGLNAGNSIQDILPSILANFVTNIVIAIPIFALIKRHPGHDLVECTSKVFGKGIACLVAFLYYLFFLLYAILTAASFDNFFVNTLIPNVSVHLTTFLLLIVCLYGVIKGIESIARVGGIAAILYLLSLLVLFIAVFPLINMGYIKPMFYSGPQYFIGGMAINYSLSIQIVCIAFLVSFHRQGSSIKKTYFAWNTISTLILLVLEFYIVTCMGAFGSEQYDPLQVLSSLTAFNLFQSLDAVDFIPWILNTIIVVSVYMYLAVYCLLKVGFNKHRKLIAILTSIIVFFVAPVVSNHIDMLQKFQSGPLASILVTVFAFVIPLIILMVDSVKERLMQDEKTA